MDALADLIRKYEQRARRIPSKYPHVSLFYENAAVAVLKLAVPKLIL